MLNFFLSAETVVIPPVHFSCANTIAFLGCSTDYVSEMIWVKKQQGKGGKLCLFNIHSSKANDLLFLPILHK